MNNETDRLVIACSAGTLIFAIAGVIAKVWLPRATGLLSFSVALALGFVVEMRRAGGFSQNARWLLAMAVVLASLAVLDFALFS